MKPTPEQYQRLLDVADRVQGIRDHDMVEAFWDTIAPMVLEESAKRAEEQWDDDTGRRIRGLALDGEPKAQP